MPTGTFTNPALAQELLEALDALSGVHRVPDRPMRRGSCASAPSRPRPSGEADPRTAREQVIHAGDRALLGFDGSADHPRQRPGALWPEGTGDSVPARRPPAHGHHRAFRQRVPGADRQGVCGIAPRHCSRRRRTGPMRSPRSSPATRTRSGSSKCPSRSRQALLARHSSLSLHSRSRTRMARAVTAAFTSGPKQAPSTSATQPRRPSPRTSSSTSWTSGSPAGRSGSTCPCKWRNTGTTLPTPVRRGRILGPRSRSARSPSRRAWMIRCRNEDRSSSTPCRGSMDSIRLVIRSPRYARTSTCTRAQAAWGLRRRAALISARTA